MIQFKKVININFAKNVIMITSGAAFTQVLNILLVPIITRLYNPIDFSIVPIFTAVLGGLSFLGSFNFEMGIPIAQTYEKAINILAFSVLALLASTIISILIILFFGPDLLNIMNGDQLIKYIYMIPIGLLLTGLYNICTQWACRNKDFKSITKTKLHQSILQNLISILSGYCGIGVVGLLIGRIVGQSAGITTLLSPIINKEKYLMTMITRRELIGVWRRYKDFLFFTTPRRYLGDVIIAIPILSMTSLYGTKIVGLFGLANSIIQLPMNLIGSSISSVYYAECASLKNSDPLKIKELSQKLFRILIWMGLLPLIILLFLGPTLFTYVFGDEWVEAGVYARILSIAVFCRFVFKPIGNIFDIFERQRIAFALNIINVILILGIFILAKYVSLNSYVTVCMYSTAMSLFYFSQYVLAQRILREEILKFIPRK